MTKSILIIQCIGEIEDLNKIQLSAIINSKQMTSKFMNYDVYDDKYKNVICLTKLKRD